ncbi:MAG: insulinase family protein [Actinobacteria bacterium]|nr:insulinase family protein [Actinomycetota bacterium]
MSISLTRLGAGLRVVTEELPALRSAAVGFWVGTGSRDEPDETAGTSHFLEHLLFKGTRDRSALEIAQAVESVGGDMNAFTTQELTAFYVRVPDDRLDVALDILSDIVWGPALRSEDVESERQVILEEIRMRDDTPDDLVHDLFASALFPGHPLGREVLGTQSSIGAMSRDAIADYHRHHYRPANVVVAAAGNLTHEHVVERVVERLTEIAGDRPARPATNGTPPRPLAVLPRPTEQAHVVLGMRGLSRHDPDRYALTVLNQAFGGGMASRLFQEVRERRGLAYSVYSYRSSFADTGAVAIYMGTAPGRVEEALAVVDGELGRLVADHGITDAELDAAKGHLKGSIALSLESSISRMHRIGSSELTLGEIPTLDEVVARVDAVGPDDIARIVDRVFGRGERTLAVVGPFEETDFQDRVA